MQPGGDWGRNTLQYFHIRQLLYISAGEVSPTLGPVEVPCLWDGGDMETEDIYQTVRDEQQVKIGKYVLSNSHTLPGKG